MEKCHYMPMKLHCHSIHHKVYPLSSRLHGRWIVTAVLNAALFSGSGLWFIDAMLLMSSKLSVWFFYMNILIVYK